MTWGATNLEVRILNISLDVWQNRTCHYAKPPWHRRRRSRSSPKSNYRPREESIFRVNGTNPWLPTGDDTRAIDLACARGARGVRAMRAVRVRVAGVRVLRRACIPGGGLRSAPLSPPTSDFVVFYSICEFHTDGMIHSWFMKLTILA